LKCEQDALAHCEEHEAEMEEQEARMDTESEGCREEGFCTWCENLYNGHYARVTPLLGDMAKLPREIVREIIEFAFGGFSREFLHEEFEACGEQHPARAWGFRWADHGWRYDYWVDYQEGIESVGEWAWSESPCEEGEN
jgi:hypothetical protein